MGGVCGRRFPYAYVLHVLSGQQFDKSIVVIHEYYYRLRTLQKRYVTNIAKAQLNSLNCLGDAHTLLKKYLH